MNEGDGRGRTRFIEHEGRRILLLDFSDIRDPAVALVAIAEARAFVATQPLGSGLQRVAFTAIKLVSGRSFKACRDIEEAKRWLAARDAGGGQDRGPGAD